LLACEDPIDMTDGGTGGQTASGGNTSLGGGAGSGSGGGSNSSTCDSNDTPFLILADEDNNMAFSSTLGLTEQMVPPSNVELTMDWSALTQDFLGHDLDFQGGMKVVALVVWDVPIEEVAEIINTDGDTNAHAIASLQHPADDPDVTSAPLTDFLTFGAPVTESALLEFLDPEAGYSFTFMAQAHETTIGRDVQMIQAFGLDADATSTTVRLTNTSTDLEWEAELDTLTPTLLPAATGDITVDWFSSITVNSYGGDFVNNQITEVLVGRYPADVDLNEQFLDIELIADDLWRGHVTKGSKINLSTLTNSDGDAFEGVPDGSSDQWLLGLLCTNCVNPTPWYVTRLETCP